jgi:ABC-type Fe3+/spermidine/putrescine transport system ATPase subunit
MMQKLRVQAVRKLYGTFAAVDDISFDVEPGEVVTLLGPSGCGKTTTLRMIAGLEHGDGGEIYLNDRLLSAPARDYFVPPEERSMGMVFQNYAVWPHMTVGENVAFPLRMHRFPKSEIKERVKRALATVGLDSLEDRPSPGLSGGQQQRVALARAIVAEPEVLLLDEPLSNLDVKLREQMRIEIKLLQARLNLTLIYVTHDQSEALGLSDRIVVLNHGRIEQIGAPRALYERPATPFVRDFLGKSITLPGRVKTITAGRATVELASNIGTMIDCAIPAGVEVASGCEVEVSLRPETIHLANGQGGALHGIVEAVLYQGERSECEVRIGDIALCVYLPPETNPVRGDKIALAIEPDAPRLWPKSSGVT